MTSTMKTILIIGGTSGIGEAFARHFHASGKKVIVAGRRTEQLRALERDLSGLQSIQWDVADFAQLESQVSSVLASFPELDTVFINAGIQKFSSFLDPSTNKPEDITTEININLTAPLLLARLFLPHLQSMASAGNPANLLMTSSTLGFVPMGFYPVYSPTKAAIHAFCLVLRQQISYASEAIKKNLHVVEIVPPYTDTGLDKEHRALTIDLQGGPENAFKPMPLDEYIQQAIKALDEGDGQGSLKKEVAVGLGQTCAETWREGFGKMFESMGMNC